MNRHMRRHPEQYPAFTVAFDEANDGGSNAGTPKTESGKQGESTEQGSGDGSEGGEGGEPTAAEEALRAQLDKAREAEAAAKKDAAEQAKRARELEKAAMSAEERQAAEAKERDQALAAWPAKMQAANLRAETAIEAQRMGLVDADAAARLVDGVEYDADHMPTNLSKRLEALVERFPFLKPAEGEAGKPAAPAKPGATGGKSASSNGKGLTADALNSMSAEQIAALPEKDVNAALRAVS